MPEVESSSSGQAHRKRNCSTLGFPLSWSEISCGAFFQAMTHHIFRAEEPQLYFNYNESPWLQNAEMNPWRHLSWTKVSTKLTVCLSTFRKKNPKKLTTRFHLCFWKELSYSRRLWSSLSIPATSLCLSASTFQHPVNSTLSLQPLTSPLTSCAFTTPSSASKQKKTKFCPLSWIWHGSAHNVYKCFRLHSQ